MLLAQGLNLTEAEIHRRLSEALLRSGTIKRILITDARVSAQFADGETAYFNALDLDTDREDGVAVNARHASN